MMVSDFIHKLRCFRHYFWYLPQIIYFNFHFLPLSQAKYLPIWVKCRNGIWKKYHHGQIIIDTDKIEFGMIELGVKQYLDQREGMAIYNMGKIIFKGKAHISHGSYISVGSNGCLTLGEGVGISTSTIFCEKSITIGKNTFLGMGCKIMDSDYHLIIDILAKSHINPTQSINIGNYNWLGTDVLVLKGAKTPNHCIVSARSIISKKYKIPECSIINNATGNEIILNGYIRDRNIETIKDLKNKSIDNFDEYIQLLIKNKKIN